MEAKFHLKREISDSLDFGIGHNPVVDVNFHSQIEIYLVRSGAVEILVNNRKRVVYAGDISVALSYDAHGYRAIEDAEVAHLIIPRSYCTEFLHLLAGSHSYFPFIDDPDTFDLVSDFLDRIILTQNELQRRGYVYVILGAILEKLTAADGIDAQEINFSADVLIYISEHFREELTLGTLAAALGYNESYLSRSFHQTFGISFGKYLSMLRLREALTLLREGKMSITECAFESGFGSMRSFSLALHEKFGGPPQEYLASL